MSVLWPALPAAQTLVLADPFWSHPGLNLGGVAHLRVWTSTAGGHLAVVTEQGLGCSVTNAAEHIHAALVGRYGPTVVQLEHYPSEQRGGEGASLDQVDVVGGRPRWRRIWPVPSTHPGHGELTGWARGGGAAVLDVLTSGSR